MFAFIIITDPIGACDTRDWLACVGGELKVESEGRLLVEGEQRVDDGWVAIQIVPEIEFDYEADELVRIRSKIHDPQFIFVEGRDGRNCFSNEFALSLPTDKLILIDNDHGFVGSVAMIQEKIRVDESWLYSDK
ncbi:hypothetical protein [Paraburkholderia tropica]|uniref:hypothetical protein n=1 Tax=Paraburkholderia tropica TaxID=92647 RepID=UPI002AB70F9F|nr:hypothetical protein [Paraburkholderia tropica]